MELRKVNCWSNTYLRCDFIFSPRTCSWGWVFSVTSVGRYTAGSTVAVYSRKAQAYRLIHGGFSREQTHLIFSPYTSYLTPLIPLLLSWIMSALIAASPSIFPPLARDIGKTEKGGTCGMPQFSIPCNSDGCFCLHSLLQLQLPLWWHSPAKEVQVKLSQ